VGEVSFESNRIIIEGVIVMTCGLVFVWAERAQSSERASDRNPAGPAQFSQARSLPGSVRLERWAGSARVRWLCGCVVLLFVWGDAAVVDAIDRRRRKASKIGMPPHARLQATCQQASRRSQALPRLLLFGVDA
jgi:hypothetical protein